MLRIALSYALHSRGTVEPVLFYFIFFTGFTDVTQC